MEGVCREGGGGSGDACVKMLNTWSKAKMEHRIMSVACKSDHIPKTPLGDKSFQKKKRGHFTHTGNEIKICRQNKCHHHLSNVCENSFRMFHRNWVISDYHSFVSAVC